MEFKPWPCCRWAHPALEAALRLKDSVAPARIESIDVYAFKEFVDTLDSPYPTNLVDAQFNARFLIASAFVADDINDALREPAFDSPALHDLFAKIRAYDDCAFDSQHRADLSIPTGLVLRLVDDSTREVLIDQPLGSHRREPMPLAASRAKFVDSLTPLLGAAPTESALATILDVETHSADQLMQALFPPI